MPHHGRNRRQMPAKAVIALGALLFVAHAEAAGLVEIYEMAKANDPTLQSARYSLEAAKQKVPEAISALLPVVSATATDGRTYGNTSYSGTPVVARGFDSFTWTVQLTQPLLRAPGAASYSESLAIAEEATAQYQLAQQDLILRVTQAYFDVLVAIESVSAAEAQLESTREQLAVAQRAFDDGTGTITDVNEGQAHADLAEAQRLSALDDLESKRGDLEAIIGKQPPPLAPIRAGFAAPRPNPDRIEAWILQAKQENPAVRAASSAVIAAQSEVTRVKFQRMPTLDLVASYGRNYSSGNINNPLNYATNAGDQQIGLQLSVPILDGGGLHAMVREAQANEGKAESDLEATKRKAAKDARDAFTGIVNGLSQIEALRSAVKSGESSVKGNRAGYALGIRINSDVLNAQQQLYSSERDLVKARYDTFSAALKLKASVGVLSDTDVQAINRLLDNELQ